MCDELKMDCVSRCIDDNEPISNYQRPRGYGGVAIAWGRRLSHRVKQIPDGNEFILPIIMKSDPKDLCIINVYLPCRGNHSEGEFDQGLDILSTIVDKFKGTHLIVILGDFNASLIDGRCSRDKKFCRWSEQLGIQLSPDYPRDGTHLHHRGNGSSTIDYILSLDPACVVNVRLLQSQAYNTSSHVPVAADIDISSDVSTQPQEPTTDFIPTTNWNKCDLEQYRTILEDIFPNLNPADEWDDAYLEATLDTLTEALLYAAEQSAPKSKPPRKHSWNGDISRAMAENKTAYHMWNEVGRPRTGDAWERKKATTKHLRRCIRQADADKRNQVYHDVMTASSSDSKMFHKLINRQKEVTSIAGNRLRVNGELVTSQCEVLKVWTNHFESLATPQQPKEYNPDYDKLVHEDLLIMNWQAENSPDEFKPISGAELQGAIKSLKNNKAADLQGLKAEHLKYASDNVKTALTVALNHAMMSKLPPILQQAYVLPVHKKGKDPLDTDCFRGITITPMYAKTLEHVNLNRQSDNLPQHELQFGFTKGSSPALAALAVTEAIAEAHDTKSPLYVLALDVRKAFDVVNQDSLCRKLNNHLDSQSWKFVQQNLKTEARVKLQGNLGVPFLVKQGVGQGKIFSTHAYKVYIHDLLDRLTDSDAGLYIGTTFIGAPCCADDIILQSKDPQALQHLIDVVADYARQERYTIHPKKSQLITYGVAAPSPPILNGTAIPCTDKLTHLGIDRYTDNVTPSQFITDRISLASRTAYALMGSGFHGMNGISPKVSIQIYRIYVIPRLMYGLEAVVLNKTQITELEAFHRKTLKNLQSLSPRTPTSAVFLLAGMPPLEALLDLRLTSLLYTIGKAPNSNLREIGWYQLARKKSTSSSWFVYCVKRLAVYDLDPSDVMSGIFSKTQLKSKILQYWDTTLRQEAAMKPSLRYLDVEKCSVSHTHPIWSSFDCTTSDTRQAIQKARIMCGTYIFQAQRAAFNQFEADPTCLMCRSAPEDRCHFLLHCPELEDIRNTHLTGIRSLVPDIDYYALADDDKIKLILDSNFVKNFKLKIDIADLEAAQRSYIFRLHCRRNLQTSS